MDKIAVKVPATTANLGPGFDCLGLALDLYSTVEVSLAPSFDMRLTGEDVGELGLGRDNLVYRAFSALYQKAGATPPEVRMACENRIPLRRGLGSSAAAIVGGLVAANFLLGEPLPQKEILRLAVEMEGHPDNVAPALLGGCQVVVWDGGELVTASIPLPAELRVVLFIPSFEMATETARGILSPRVSRKDAVYNIGRAALLANALATGQWSYLRVATQDRLHQPRRRSLFPALDDIIEAALESGALGAFLSGGGSAVAALASGQEAPIGWAMTEAAARAGVSGRILKAKPSLQGAYKVEI
ncbi:MAG: homoserine kinase [Chloroflexi bacterium]|nr:homoserine kinase [Chloroflexota bacterium]